MKKTTKDKLLDYSRLKFKVKRHMRYHDVGDYYENTIISYDMKNPVINNGIMLHEFIEYTLIKSAGIPESMIDAFDTEDEACDKYENEFKLYNKYHRIANNVERHFIENMGMDWNEYQKAIYSEDVKIRKARKNNKDTEDRKSRIR